jgi:hypothetical protein
VTRTLGRVEHRYQLAELRNLSFTLVLGDQLLNWFRPGVGKLYEANQSSLCPSLCGHELRMFMILKGDKTHTTQHTKQIYFVPWPWTMETSYKDRLLT